MEFSDTEFQESIRLACEYCEIKAPASLVAQDCMESVCLIQKDGLVNIFAHRSFQEYFCALFIANYREEGVDRLIQSVVDIERRSNTLSMLFELAPEVFDYEWLLPKFEQFLKQFGRLRLDTKSGLAKFLNGVFNEIYVDIETGYVSYISLGLLKNSDTAGMWMSAAEFAHKENLGFRELFGSPIWKSLKDFCKKQEKNSVPSYAQLAERFESSGPRDSDTTALGLSSRDADWLIFTDLPILLSNIRETVKQAREEILSRRQTRRQSIDDLIKKRPPRRFIAS